MRALNKYFRRTLPQFNRDAVYEKHLLSYEHLPNDSPNYCKQRDYSHASTVKLTAVDEGTEGKNRTTQEAILQQKGLVFSDPRDMAIAAALHACKHNGADLFQRCTYVRGFVPGVALELDLFLGVFVCQWYGDDYSSAAASGSPSPESK